MIVTLDLDKRQSEMLSSAVAKHFLKVAREFNAAAEADKPSLAECYWQAGELDRKVREAVLKPLLQVRQPPDRPAP